MDFFEDNLLDDVINFKKTDEVNSQSSDEIYIFKRENKEEDLKLIQKPAHTESNEDLGIIDLDN